MVWCNWSWNRPWLCATFACYKCFDILKLVSKVFHFCFSTVKFFLSFLQFSSNLTSFSDQNRSFGSHESKDRVRLGFSLFLPRLRQTLPDDPGNPIANAAKVRRRKLLRRFETKDQSVDLGVWLRPKTDRKPLVPELSNFSALDNADGAQPSAGQPIVFRHQRLPPTVRLWNQNQKLSWIAQGKIIL